MECSPSDSEQDTEAQSRKEAGLEKRGPSPSSPDPKPSDLSTSPSLRAPLSVPCYLWSFQCDEELIFDENMFLAQNPPHPAPHQGVYIFPLRSPQLRDLQGQGSLAPIPPISSQLSPTPSEAALKSPVPPSVKAGIVLSVTRPDTRLQ